MTDEFIVFKVTKDVPHRRSRYFFKKGDVARVMQQPGGAILKLYSGKTVYLTEFEFANWTRKADPQKRLDRAKIAAFLLTDAGGASWATPE
jgi:hypothetical protein